MSLGNFTQDPPDPYTTDVAYPRQDAGLRLQLGPPGSAALFLADFTQLGIVGVPAMAGRVSMINPKLAEVSFFELTPADTIHTYVYDPAVPAESGPGILAPDVRIELTLKSFDRFTQTVPAGATGPTLHENPFIGPDPLAALEGVSPLPTTPPGITVSLGGNQATGSFLLDTGSQITSISSPMALTLGVRYWAPGDPGYDPASQRHWCTMRTARSSRTRSPLTSAASRARRRSPASMQTRFWCARWKAIPSSTRTRTT